MGVAVVYFYCYCYCMLHAVVMAMVMVGFWNRCTPIRNIDVQIKTKNYIICGLSCTCLHIMYLGGGEEEVRLLLPDDDRRFFIASYLQYLLDLKGFRI